MKLLARIALRLSLVLAPIMTLWGVLFYFAMIEEINDEMDDNLESYSELIIVRMLTHNQLPSLDSGSNNSYSITPIDAQYHNFWRSCSETHCNGTPRKYILFRCRNAFSSL